jgi:hypothetical protein
MTWMPIDGAGRLPTSEPTTRAWNIPSGLHLAGSVLRVLFIACLLAIIVRVAMPQNETIWTVYETPGDAIRLALGLAVCAWVSVQLFRVPTDSHSHRTWVYFGLAAVPFAALCLFAIW